MATAVEILSKLRILRLILEPPGPLNQPSGRRFTIEANPSKPGEPFTWVGGFAVVCRAHDEDGRKRALRFFMGRTPLHQTQITAFLSQNKHPALVGGQMHRKALSLKSGESVDMMEMDFVDGISLEREAASRIDPGGNPAELAVLAEDFRTMVLGLIDLGFYHGDLSHSNILVEGGELRLIDYDSVFIHGANNPPEGEAGHPCFQHPSRSKSRFTRLDDIYFSALVIYISLHALAKSPVLWEKYHSEGDNLIFQHNLKDLKETSTPLWNDLGRINFEDDVRKCLDVLRHAVQGQDLLVGDFRSGIEDTFASGSPPPPVPPPSPTPLPPRPTPSPTPSPIPHAEVVTGKRWLTRSPQAEVVTGRRRPTGTTTKVVQGSNWLSEQEPEPELEPEPAPEPDPKPPEDDTSESKSPEGQDDDEEEPSGLDKVRSAFSKLRKAQIEPEVEQYTWDDGWGKKSKSAPMSVDQMIIIDASNIVHMRRPLEIRTLVSLIDYLSSFGLSNIRSVADPNLRHIVEDKEEYESMNNEDPFFTQSPRGIPADVPILEHGLNLEAVIITNDAFMDHIDAHPDEYNWFKRHHLQVSLMDGNWAIMPKIEIIREEEE